MCRLYGQIGPTAQSAEDFLVNAKHSLLSQSDYNRRNLQKDGWGFGYFEGRRCKVSKSPKAAFEEASRFKSLASRTRSRVMIAHLRAASNPRGLPYRRLIGIENSQP